jgi:polysaccharide export outer membrane protein
MCFRNLNRNGLFFALIILGSLAVTSSCTSIKELTYLQGIDTAKLSQVNPVQPVIRKGDILTIIVFSDNPEATKIFNQSLISGASASGTTSTDVQTSGGIKGNTPSSPGYEVDQYGNIMFQGLGLLHVEGLTRAQLKDTLDSKLKDFLKNPYYDIRFQNYKFTMLGELNKPGVVSIPGEKINLLEAIALSGDLTFYGRRDNILVIRETNGKRETGRVNILKPEAMASPYYYLQQNDIVIVEATKKKANANEVVVYRDIALALAFVSTFTVVYSIFYHH